MYLICSAFVGSNQGGSVNHIRNANELFAFSKRTGSNTYGFTIVFIATGTTATLDYVCYPYTGDSALYKVCLIE